MPLKHQHNVDLVQMHPRITKKFKDERIGSLLSIVKLLVGNKFYLKAINLAGIEERPEE